MINANFERLKAKLRRNKARGKEARADLINRLAAMDADKLRKVNPILIRKLGAQGIAEIASRNRAAATREAANVPKTGMSSVERTLPEIIRGVAETLLAFLTRKRLFQTLAKTVAVGTALGLVISFAANLAIVFLANWLNPVTPTSPCPRLDGLAIDCVCRRVILLAFNSFVSLIIIAPRERTAGSLALFSVSPSKRFRVKFDRLHAALERAAD